MKIIKLQQKNTVELTIIVNRLLLLLQGCQLIANQCCKFSFFLVAFSFLVLVFGVLVKFF